MVAPPRENTALVQDHDYDEAVLHHQNSNVKSLGEDLPLYSPPRQRQRWNDPQILPHVNWGDLFFDLFYVAAAYNLAIILKESTNIEGLACFAGCYFSIIVLWYERLGWDARYVYDDNLCIRSVDIVHLVLLGMAIQHIQPVEIMTDTCGHSTTLVYLSCLSVLFCIHLLMKVDLALHIQGGPEGKTAAKVDIVLKLCGCLPIWTATLLAAYDYVHFAPQDSLACQQHGRNFLPVILPGITIVLEQASYFLSLHILQRRGWTIEEITVPFNVELCTHRYGEWTMLMLGESVLSLIIVEASPGRRYYVTFVTGIVSVTMLQYLYFRSTPRSTDDHAMRRNYFGAFQYYYSMLLYGAVLLVIGCSFKVILHYYLEEYEQSHHQQEGGKIVDQQEEPLDSTRRIALMFSWSLSSSFFLLDLIIISHRGWGSFISRLVKNQQIQWKPTMWTLADLGLTLLTACFPSFIHDLEVLSVAGCAAVLGQVLLRTLGMRYFPVKSQEPQARSTTLA